MCRYCKLENISKYDKESVGGKIGKIRDGSQLFEVCMFRYINEETGTRQNELILELAGEAQYGGVYTMKTKKIKIKYCPFCGEEL